MNTGTLPASSLAKAEIDTATLPGLRLLGDVRWYGGGASLPFLPERRFQLLALLACRRDWVPRRLLAEQLWSERTQADALRNLRKIVLQAGRLAKALPQAPALELQGDRLRWCPRSDLADFLHACDAGLHAQAAQGYRPGLMRSLEAGLDEAALDWLVRQRAWLEQRWHQAVQRWLDDLAHDPAALADAAEQVLARDPLHEATLRALLRACQALGETARAQRALRLHAQRLQQELGTTPAPDLALAATPAKAVPMALPARDIGSAAVQKIIEAAMDVIADDRQWPVLLQHLAQATHGSGALLAACSFTRPPDGLLLTHGLDPLLGERFLQQYQDNPWARAMVRVPPGRAVDQTLLIAPGVVERTAFHHEIVRPQGIRHMAAMSMPMPMGRQFACGGVSIAFGGSHARTHADGATRLLEHVAPYLQRATAALLRWQGLPCAATLHASLQRMPHAVMILAADARLLFANERAEALLSRGDGLRLRQGRLVAGHPAEAPRLDEVLCQAARTRTPPPATPCADLHLRLRQRSAPAPLRISVAPLHEDDARQPVPARAAVLVLVEPPA